MATQGWTPELDNAQFYPRMGGGGWSKYLGSTNAGWLNVYRGYTATSLAKVWPTSFSNFAAWRIREQGLPTGALMIKARINGGDEGVYANRVACDALRPFVSVALHHFGVVGATHARRKG